MSKLTLTNSKIVRETAKAYLIAFPETSNLKEYAVWFPKSKVSIEGKTFTIEIMSEEYKMILKDEIKISLDEMAKEYGAIVLE